MFHVEQCEELVRVLAGAVGSFGFPFTEQIRSDFKMYLSELRAWNKKTNLTTITKERDIAVKHFLDSLAACSLLGPVEGRSLLDIGSGAGFPGLPLKIVYPELDVVLLEPSLKKTAFLRHVIGTLRLNRATVVSARIEDVGKRAEYRHRFDYIVTRALRQELVLPYVGQLLASAGRVLLYRATPLEKPTEPFGLKLLKEHRYSLSHEYGTRVLSVLGRA